MSRETERTGHIGAFPNATGVPDRLRGGSGVEPVGAGRRNRGQVNDKYGLRAAIVGLYFIESSYLKESSQLAASNCR